MLRFIFGIFIVLHGFVYLLYSGHSWRLFELKPGLAWPDGSWALSKLLGDEATRLVVGILYILVAIGFIACGIGLFAKQAWWHPVVVWTAVVSIVLAFLFWDGGIRGLADKGGIGLLISLAILVALLVLRWPSFEL